MPKKLSKEEFVEICKNIHDDFYDYSSVSYKNIKNKIKIICPVHGEFEQVADNHRRGHGCNKCAISSQVKQLSLTLEQAINDFKKIHGDKYDYSKVQYKNRSTKVIIVCPTHGDFLKSPAKHKAGQGCPQCSKIQSILKSKNTKTGVPSKKRHTTEHTIKDFKKIHGDKYDYSRVEYINSSTKVVICCPTHGDFLKSPAKHKAGQGCPECSRGALYSKKQVDWLKSLKKDIIIEYRIPENLLRSVDGYDPETNTVYQFHGDYFHGNPKVYNGNDINKLLKKSFSQLHEETIKKDKELLDYGYNLVIMWENEWDNLI